MSDLKDYKICYRLSNPDGVSIVDSTQVRCFCFYNAFRMFEDFIFVNKDGTFTGRDVEIISIHKV